MKVLILKDRNNKLIKAILKGSKQESRPEAICYYNQAVYVTDGMRALKIDSDFFSFDFQPEDNKMYDIVSQSNNKPGVMYYLEESCNSVPNFDGVFPTEENKGKLFPCQIDSDIIANNVIINIFKAVGCGIRYDFIKDLISNDNEVIYVYGKDDSKPILFEYTGSAFLVMPYKIKDTL